LFFECFEEVGALLGPVLPFLLKFDDVESDEPVAEGEVAVDGFDGIGLQCDMGLGDGGGKVG